MGLTSASTGRGAADDGLCIRRLRPSDRVVALAGNPNVGKSTVFNGLTGLRQHTGNWPGKTVATAQGRLTRDGQGVILVDIPGMYSLVAHSEEEVVARDYLCFGAPDAVAVVCDASGLARNLNLVLQILELTPHVVVCVNLMDEARKKGITVDCAALANTLGVPVIPTAARTGEGLDRLADALCAPPEPRSVCHTRYPAPIEAALDRLHRRMTRATTRPTATRWAALRLLENRTDAALRMLAAGGVQPDAQMAIAAQAASERAMLHDCGWSERRVRDAVVSALVRHAARVADACTTLPPSYRRTMRWDRFLTGRRTGLPVMAALLLVVLWLTVSGATPVSDLLHAGLDALGGLLRRGLQSVLPAGVCGLLVDGVWQVLAWVVSVMLPPMAIFFPLFTLLEDVGYLPRIAFNLDRAFRRAGTCGKQALTMCMGFGCNAAGVTGCRIIDSPRERRIAMLTNGFVPCNGRFPPPPGGKMQTVRAGYAKFHPASAPDARPIGLSERKIAACDCTSFKNRSTGVRQRPNDAF